jgi:uncharacterized protein YyaL (SSP411 family)
MKLLSAQYAPPPGMTKLGPPVLDRIYQSIKTGYDATYGGFGKAPKFPAGRVQFPVALLRAHRRQGGA